MPISALLGDGTHVKARQYAPDLWRSFVGSEDRPDFHCVSCLAEMFPKTSPLGLHFLSHHAGGPDCVFRIAAGGGESSRHMRMKDYLTAAVDAVPGWEGWPERRVERDGHSRIADVYAEPTTSDSPPGIYEVQLSRAPDANILERTAFYSGAGAVPTWVTMAEVPWFRSVPSLRVEQAVNGRLQVVDGLMCGDEKAPATLLERFVAKRLAGRYRFVENQGIVERSHIVARPPRPQNGERRSWGGSDDCHRAPSGPRYRVNPPMGVEPDTPPPLEERTGDTCHHVGCRRDPDVLVTFVAKGAGVAAMCRDHADTLADSIVMSIEEMVTA